MTNNPNQNALDLLNAFCDGFDGERLTLPHSTAFWMPILLGYL